LGYQLPRDQWENFEKHENMIGNAYQLGRLSILVINRIRDIYIVALQKSVAGTIAQFPFVPIHTSVMEEFVSSAELIGTGVPASIEKSFKRWEEGGGCYFTISPEEIWTLGVSCLENGGKKPKDYVRDNYFLFPPVWPGTMDSLDNFEGDYVVLDHSIGEKSNPVSN
jgi:hypothetical protein